MRRFLRHFKPAVLEWLTMILTFTTAITLAKLLGADLDSVFWWGCLTTITIQLGVNAIRRDIRELKDQRTTAENYEKF